MEGCVGVGGVEEVGTNSVWSKGEILEGGGEG